jgi:hypothetical protein
MNKLEELHFNINQKFMLGEQLAIKSAEITTDIAIKFAEFSSQYYDEDLTKDQWFNYSLNAEKKILTSQEIFEEFINNHYGK